MIFVCLFQRPQIVQQCYTTSIFLNYFIIKPVNAIAFLTIDRAFQVSKSVCEGNFQQNARKIVERLYIIRMYAIG